MSFASSDLKVPPEVEALVSSYPSYPLLKRFQEFDAHWNGLLSIEEALQIADEFNFPISQERLEKRITVDEAGKKRISYNEYLERWRGLASSNQ